LYTVPVENKAGVVGAVTAVIVLNVERGVLTLKEMVHLWTLEISLNSTFNHLNQVQYLQPPAALKSVALTHTLESFCVETNLILDG
jgi:hypothetical protein